MNIRGSNSIVGSLPWKPSHARKLQKPGLPWSYNTRSDLLQCKNSSPAGLYRSCIMFQGKRLNLNDRRKRIRLVLQIKIFYVHNWTLRSEYYLTSNHITVPWGDFFAFSHRFACPLCICPGWIYATTSARSRNLAILVSVENLARYY